MAVGLDSNGKTWYFVIDLPPRPDGRRRQMRRRGFADQATAGAAEAAAVQRFASLDLGADGTVAGELARWLDERELDLSVTGLASYRDYIRAYVNPHIGDRQLYTLDKHALHELYKTLLRSGSRRGGPLSPSTVRTVHRILRKALHDLGLDLSGVRQPRKPRRLNYGRKGIWTAEQTATFLAAVREDRLYAAWVLATVCGMRRGELAGLRWSKVDLVRGVVRADWQRTTATGQGERGVVEKEAKGTSARNIAIGPAVVAVLAAHRQRQDEERKLAAEIYRNENRVFCREDGLGYRPAYFTRRFASLCGSVGVPEIVLHDARHTSATVGADHGIPQHAMQHRLGHADARVTAEIYTHVLPEAQRKAADIMERVMLPHRVNGSGAARDTPSS
jgi:integrase